MPPKTNGLGQGSPRRSKRLQDPTWADFGPTWPQLGTNLAPKSKPKNSRRFQNLSCQHRHRKWLQFLPPNHCFLCWFLKSFVIASEVVFLLRYQKRMSKKHGKHCVFKGFLKIGFYIESVTVSWKLTSRGLQISRFFQVNAGIDFCPILAWFWSRFRPKLGLEAALSVEESLAQGHSFSEAHTMQNDIFSLRRLER